MDQLLEWLNSGYSLLKVLIGFSVIIFVHELGHFLAAKWAGIRVDRFAVGFFTRIFGYRQGEGFTLGPRPTYRPQDLAEKGYGETDYCLNILPFGGYVKMLGEDDIVINEETGEIKRTDDPRAFPNKSVGKRMVVVSAGVLCNVLFAILVYAFVFLVPGLTTTAPVLGKVEPGTAAEQAGLQAGDEVLQIDGKAIESLMDVKKSRMLADAPGDFLILRDGQRLHIEVPPPKLAGGEFRSEFQPMISLRIADLRQTDEAGPQPHDEVVALNGEPVKNGVELRRRLLRDTSERVEVTVRRPDPKAPGGSREVTFSRDPELVPFPDETSGASAGGAEGLLGFRRRMAVTDVEPGSPADAAGIKAGDAIAQWGNVVNPQYQDVISVIKSHASTPIAVVVQRGTARVELSVTPRSTLGLFGTPRVGIVFGTKEQKPPIVADVEPDTPAAALGVPRGAELTAVNGQPVTSWGDVYKALRRAAGGKAEISYQVGGERVSGTMEVPSSLVDELRLPPNALIRSIAGERSVTGDQGHDLALPAPGAVRKLLEKNVGRTVRIEYVDEPFATDIRTGMFTVRSDNIDPWQLRDLFDLELPLEPLERPVTANGNPLRALVMGTRATWEGVEDIYLLLRKWAHSALTREPSAVGLQQLSGPVSIVRIAMVQAKSGYADLLALLAYISVNLAVLNFLPLPVVDGGLMMFLILEKFRGRPLNVKVQVITTLAGLVLIVLVFLVVTFQDIAKWIHGSI